MQRTLIMSLVLLLAAAFFANARAEVSRGEALAVHCAACHGGQQRGAGRIPDLDDDAGEIREDLIAFKSGERKGTIMGRIARGYSDDEILLMADYLGRR